MLKTYFFVATVGLFGSSYSMEKEQAKPEYLEDALQLSQVRGLYFNLLPKDILGIVQYYRLAELLDREIEKALGNKYEKALKNIAHLAQAAEYVHLFNNPQFIDGVINRISSKFGQVPQDVAQAINTLGVRLWIQVIRPDQIKFLEAALIGDLSLVQQLIAQGVNVNARNIAGGTALMRAAFKGRIAILKELIIAKADVNAQDENGSTALTRAAYWGHTEVVKELIDAGANIDAQTEDGKTALYWARESGYAGIVELLEKATKK